MPVARPPRSLAAGSSPPRPEARPSPAAAGLVRGAAYLTSRAHTVEGRSGPRPDRAARRGQSVPSGGLDEGRGPRARRAWWAGPPARRRTRTAPARAAVTNAGLPAAEGAVVLAGLPHIVLGTHQRKGHGSPVPADGLGQADDVGDDAGRFEGEERSVRPQPVRMSSTTSSTRYSRPVRQGRRVLTTAMPAASCAIAEQNPSRPDSAVRVVVAVTSPGTSRQTHPPTTRENGTHTLPHP